MTGKSPDNLSQILLLRDIVEEYTREYQRLSEPVTYGALALMLDMAAAKAEHSEE